MTKLTDRTIAAVATPQGTGGISVIRISGHDAIEIADRVFCGKSLKDAPSHTIHYGFIKNTKGEKIDEVLVSLMRAPRTFTREDTVEISCHGGTVTTHAVLRTVIEAGAHMAEPGEFTKRAFLNGRIDLSQAEAVIDVINAKNELSQRNAISQLGGTLSKEIKSVRAELVHLCAEMQVIIDYPDEDLEDVTEDDIKNVCRSCADKVSRLIETSDNGRMMRDGIRTAIVGKPNVGKSSILNCLAQDERAIVTDIAGTTRDVIEESVTIKGIPLILSDTAGIRQTDDVVEKIGVTKSMQYLDSADLVIVVIDGAENMDNEDEDVLLATKDKNRIILLNKSDIGTKTTKDAFCADDTVIKISAKTGDGTDALADAIEKLCRLDAIESENGRIITNMRHKTALIGARDALTRVADALEAGMPCDIVSIDIAGAMDCLGEITGETVSESVVADIFHNFCVGK
ncbi:MAG: tRNA uridine-5-carboxymethylaminomethyl(34) synthesis GTPase MnmE [Clostridia bacterium]|nr:tRNA uridine-5-carboxymethylaminomethyl(34) synthesis GTPase MnmE [Clostridia bacterium]